MNSVRPRKSYMSPAVFRALRESTGLTPTAWGYFLDCSAGTVANIEASASSSRPKTISKQMAYLATLMAHPSVRALLPAVFALEQRIMAQVENSTIPKEHPCQP